MFQANTGDTGAPQFAFDATGNSLTAGTATSAALFTAIPAIGTAGRRRLAARLDAGRRLADRRRRSGDVHGQARDEGRHVRHRHELRRRGRSRAARSGGRAGRTTLATKRSSRVQNEVAWMYRRDRAFERGRGVRFRQRREPRPPGEGTPRTRCARTRSRVRARTRSTARSRDTSSTRSFRSRKRCGGSALPSAATTVAVRARESVARRARRSASCDRRRARRHHRPWHALRSRRASSSISSIRARRTRTRRIGSRRPSCG